MDIQDPVVDLRGEVHIEAVRRLVVVRLEEETLEETHIVLEEEVEV